MARAEWRTIGWDLGVAGHVAVLIVGRACDGVTVTDAACHDHVAKAITRCRRTKRCLSKVNRDAVVDEIAIDQKCPLAIISANCGDCVRDRAELGDRTRHATDFVLLSRGLACQQISLSPLTPCLALPLHCTFLCYKSTSACQRLIISLLTSLPNLKHSTCRHPQTYRQAFVMSGYDFSPLYRSVRSAFSPGSTFLATVHSNRLIVRSTRNLAIVRAWAIACLAAGVDGGAGPSRPRTASVDEIQWSDDGLYILAFSREEGCVWVYALAQEGNGEDGEVARIKAGPEGLEGVRWAKDGREVMCRSEHNVRLYTRSCRRLLGHCLDIGTASLFI